MSHKQGGLIHQFGVPLGGDLKNILLYYYYYYENKIFKHLGKMKTHWLGPYVVKEMIDGGAVKLEKLDGTEVRGLVNGSRLKPYFHSYDLVT